MRKLHRTFTFGLCLLVGTVVLGVCLGREVTQVRAHPAPSTRGPPGLTYPG